MAAGPGVQKAAVVVASATLLSRVCGFIRDMLFAALFGAGMYSDAFVAAFRLPNLLRRLFAEGSLGIALIPTLARYFTRQGREAVFDLTCSAARFIGVALAAGVVGTIILAPWLVQGLAPGFAQRPEQFALTVLLTRIMAPYMLLVGMAAIFMALLNFLRHFATPALAPVVLNAAMITAMLVGLHFFPSARTRVLLLAAAVTVGGLGQLMLQMPILVRKGVRPWRRAPLRHPGLKTMRHMALPAVFGASVYQINLVLTTLLATLLPEGSVTYLYLADRLVQLPLALFGVSAATALLPELAGNAAAGDMRRFRETYQHTLQVVLTVAVPATVGLIVMREPIVEFLFRRGAFGGQAVQATSAALLFYATGMWALVALRVVGAGYFALQQTRLPVRAGVAAVGINLVCGVGLMSSMGHAGLALALSLSALVNLAVLALGLRGGPAALLWRRLGRSVCKIVLCSVIMGLAVKFTAVVWMPDANAPLAKSAAGVLAGVLTGVIVYGLAARVFMPVELQSVWVGMRNRMGAK